MGRDVLAGKKKSASISESLVTLPASSSLKGQALLDSLKRYERDEAPITE